jgi:ankyrin repeat protein
LSFLQLSPINPALAAELGNVKDLEIQAAVNKAGLFEEDDNGWQPIHLAARSGHINVIDFLLKNGADLNAKAGTRTPYRIAREYHGLGHPVEWFLRNKGGR